LRSGAFFLPNNNQNAVNGNERNKDGGHGNFCFDAPVCRGERGPPMTDGPEKPINPLWAIDEILIACNGFVSASGAWPSTT
jgi:hypothetical protein